MTQRVKDRMTDPEDTSPCTTAPSTGYCMINYGTQRLIGDPRTWLLSDSGGEMMF